MIIWVMIHDRVVLLNDGKKTSILNDHVDYGKRLFRSYLHDGEVFFLNDGKMAS